MKTNDSRGNMFSPASVLGIMILGIGLLVAIWQIPMIFNHVYWDEQTDLVGDLCWIAIGVAIELFGIGLITVGNRK